MVDIPRVARLAELPLHGVGEAPRLARAASEVPGHGVVVFIGSRRFQLENASVVPSARIRRAVARLAFVVFLSSVVLLG